MGEGRWSCREEVRGRWWEVREEVWQVERTSVWLSGPSPCLCRENKTFIGAELYLQLFPPLSEMY